MPTPGQHEAVDHDKAYARQGKTGTARCHTAEGFFSIFKRGLVGTYQHMGEQHLPCYLAEFDFRMSNRTSLGVHVTPCAPNSPSKARKASG